MHLPMSTVEGSKLALRCTHCGREVAETVHTRSSYQVDYYLLHTGEVQPTTVARPDDPAGSITVLKLLRVNTVITCADCYRPAPGARSAPRTAHSGARTFRCGPR